MHLCGWDWKGKTLYLAVGAQAEPVECTTAIGTIKTKISCCRNKLHLATLNPAHLGSQCGPVRPHCQLKSPRLLNREESPSYPLGCRTVIGEKNKSSRNNENLNPTIQPEDAFATHAPTHVECTIAVGTIKTKINCCRNNLHQLAAAQKRNQSPSSGITEERRLKPTN